MVVNKIGLGLLGHRTLKSGVSQEWSDKIERISGFDLTSKMIREFS